MQKLLELDLGKRKIRYWLSDEVLCLGSQTAPITSEFSSGLSLYEAYKHGQEPSSASVYMSEEQVTWLVDELYSALGAKNSKITYEDINIDEGKKVSLKDFVALRPVSFRNNVAGFRRKCGIPMITKAMMAEQKQSNGVNTLAVQQRQTNGSNLGRMQTSALSSPTVQSNTRNTLDSAERASSGLHGTPRPRETESVSQSVSYLHEAGLKAGFEGSTAVKSQAQAKPPDATAPKAFVSLTKAERQARLQAQREELLRKHLEQQRISLPSHRRFYRNLVKYGGAALACDVESWTEDAEVLLELGMSWIIWEPSEGNVSGRKREGGNCHYSTSPF